ncbi:hypothetical protein EVAR_48303_1 [Eumeta japonica]|uniref:Uncharacterized protein n=1 Tax=Eumeta variegata TaxID=151549 RepID=A0A4C1WLG5_EUMVA|nr:hypothetical protein EVAR_48303_1 [Eumeta japonica]
MVAVAEGSRAVCAFSTETAESAPEGAALVTAVVSSSRSALRQYARMLTKQFTCRLCAAAVSLLLGRIGRWSGREITRSVFSLARSAQVERDDESDVHKNAWELVCGAAVEATTNTFVRTRSEETTETDDKGNPLWRAHRSCVYYLCTLAGSGGFRFFPRGRPAAARGGWRLRDRLSINILRTLLLIDFLATRKWAGVPHEIPRSHSMQILNDNIRGFIQLVRVPVAHSSLHHFNPFISHSPSIHSQEAGNAQGFKGTKGLAALDVKGMDVTYPDNGTLYDGKQLASPSKRKVPLLKPDYGQFVKRAFNLRGNYKPLVRASGHTNVSDFVVSDPRPASAQWR